MENEEDEEDGEKELAAKEEGSNQVYRKQGDGGGGMSTGEGARVSDTERSGQRIGRRGRLDVHYAGSGHLFWTDSAVYARPE